MLEGGVNLNNVNVADSIATLPWQDPRECDTNHGGINLQKGQEEGRVNSVNVHTKDITKYLRIISV